MYHPALVHGSLHLVLQLGGRFGPVDSGLVAFLPESGLAAHPHYIIYRQFVSEYCGHSLVYVHQRRQPGEIQAEEIEEGGILTVRVGVVGVVHPGLVVAQEKEKSGLAVVFHIGHQTGSPLNISLSGKHGSIFIGCTDFKDTNYNLFYLHLYRNSI